MGITTSPTNAGGSFPSFLAHPSQVQSRRWALSSEFESLGLSVVGQGVINCPRCGEYLSLHQPDVYLPERKIATCEECKSWFLLDCGAGVMLLLPDEEYLRNS
jgi:hypothetical protein